ncbi:MAG TPA: SseB family protein [Gammaproteobacteria bacterium]|nr:SseB family protein [Gammaproteobacteria bacterium]
MSNRFTPHNDLEQRLQALQEGRLEVNTFMHNLLDEQLFMPVEDDSSEIQGLQTTTRAKPLTLDTEDGQTVLILFTSPERAKPFVAGLGNYNGGLLVDFGWILERVGGGIGISINPGHEIGLDLEEDMVAGLIQLHADRAGNPQGEA